MSKIEVKYVDPASLVLYDKNPRCNDAAVGAVARSIAEFGFKVPVVVDGGNVIVCGHTRVKAAKELKLKEIPVIVAADLSPRQIQAFRIADNQTAALAEWDYSLLEEEVRKLSAVKYDVDLLGFDDDEMAKLLGEFGDGESFFDDDESHSGNVTKKQKNADRGLRAIIEIPPKIWLLQSDDFMAAVNAVLGEYGARVEWPEN